MISGKRKISDGNKSSAKRGRKKRKVGKRNSTYSCQDANAPISRSRLSTKRRNADRRSSSAPAPKRKLKTKIWVWNIQNAKMENIASKLNTILSLFKISENFLPDAIFFTEILDKDVAKYLFDEIHELANYKYFVTELLCQDIKRKEKIITFYKQDTCCLTTKDLIQNADSASQNNVEYSRRGRLLRSGPKTYFEYGQQRNGILFQINGITCSIVHFRGPGYTESPNGRKTTKKYFDEMPKQDVDCALGDMNMKSDDMIKLCIGNFINVDSNKVQIYRGSKGCYQEVSKWDSSLSNKQVTIKVCL